ncbi:MAG: RNase III inhibitor [Isosphaeraceae bacterium]|nr:MAG: RNase III inhibitor [Isosphaeraceae bacterium]
MIRHELGAGKRIELVEGDITHQAVDAIVNAANRTLLGGGGVDGAIHRAGGPEILEACRALRATTHRDGLSTGQAVMTTAGRMPARAVIHTVGPIYVDGRHGEPEALASCYRESLRLAEAAGMKSVAFPAISTGAYGYPLAEAAAIAVEAIVEELGRCRAVEHVRLVVRGAEALEQFAAAARRRLGGEPDFGATGVERPGGI